MCILNVTHCVSYNLATKNCSTCASGYSLSTISSCVKTIFGCTSYDAMGSCLLCLPTLVKAADYYNPPMVYCWIPGCVTYQGTVCSSCSQGNGWKASADGLSCVYSGPWKYDYRSILFKIRVYDCWNGFNRQIKLKLLIGYFAIKIY